MFFQINVTPKEKKAARKCTQDEKAEDSKQQELYTLVLAPFQPQTRIKLDTTVYNSVQCILNVKNPSNRNLHVTVSKTPPNERSIELSALELSVEAESSADIGITWTPQESGSWRDTLQLTDSRRVKYDVALVTTAMGVKKSGTRLKSRVLGPSNSNKTSNPVTRKFVPPAPREPKKKANTCGLGPPNVPNKRPRLNVRPDNKENSTKSGWTYETTNCEKYNSHRDSPINDFSALINSTRFNLTPLNTNTNDDKRIPKIEITKPCEIKFSPRDTIIVSPEISNPPILRRETYTAAKYRKVLTINYEELNEDDESFDDSLSPQSDERSEPKIVVKPDENVPSSDFSFLISNMNFLTPKAPGNSVEHAIFSPNGCSTGTTTRATIAADSSRHDASSIGIVANDTFNVSPTNTMNDSPANGTYELPASPTGCKNFVRPTRLSNSFGPTLTSTFQHKVPASSSPVRFDDSSIRRDCEDRRMSVCPTSFTTPYDDASVRDVLEADLWVKPDVNQSAFTLSSLKERCSSLEKIVEERDSTITQCRTNWTKNYSPTVKDKSSKPRRNEVTPPKKYFANAKLSSMRRVSPTKSTIIRREKIVVEQSSNLKKKLQINCSIKGGRVNCPGVRIANLSLAGLKKNARVKEKSSTEHNHDTRETSVKLHDPNDFITRFCNPDPFGATTTQDPFLTSTLYYDEKWIHHQELEFKKWLNALLTAPEHLDADVDTIRVDVGKVWQSCRSRDDVGLAETRETVSARYHTNTKLNTLRKAACAMFRRDEVVTALSRATVCVERGTLMIRQDRDLHRDIGLQKEILELFLSYNPLWLRIGLETVYGETIPLSSNNDLVGLTRFIITRFFADPYIVKTHSHVNVTTLKLPSFVVNMNKFILKKFLLVVYFLDYSKRNKLIGHDPCLFHKRACHKDSRSVLLTFSRELLSGVGDVTKVLRAHGYVVSHKQTYLDEYDYAVENLTVDLRDGVRLCRVMELINGDKNLTCRCRVPAISRLQKVHNVDVALTALLRCGYTLTGDIDAKSVADGHREKTLSLLWQIIYKYQAPRYEKSAKTLQKWWRATLWYVRVRNFLRRREYDAAATIQRCWRCRRSREHLKKLRDERERQRITMERAVRVIQLRWIASLRMSMERKKFFATKRAIVRIQRWYRRRRATVDYVREFARKRRAATTIQLYWRGLVQTKKLQKRYTNVANACRKIQRWWRAVRVGRECRENYRSIKRSVSLLQSRWRGRILAKTARESYLAKLKSAKIVQSWWRRILSFKRDRNDYLVKKHAIIIIEKWWNERNIVRSEMKKFATLKKSAIVVQRFWKRYSQTKNYVASYKRRINACREIQRWWRSAIVAKRYKRQRRSCVVVQRWWRSIVSMRLKMAEFARIRNAAIVAQKNWRTKKAREDYSRAKIIIVRIQRWYRNVRISRVVRREYVEKRRAIVVVQRYWRSSKLAREKRSEFLRYREAVVAVQTKWRNKKLATTVRNDYLMKKRAATRIQTFWRMIVERRNYKRLIERHVAAEKLQKRWRSILRAREDRNNYVELRRSIVVIQKRFRALQLARRDRTNYTAIKRATVIVQKNWRMHVARMNYKKIKRATTIVESRWIARKKCIESRKNFLILKKMVISIQRRYRAMKIGRGIRNDYTKLRSTVINLQIRWRANLSMRREMINFGNFKKAVTTIQSCWRMILERRRYRRIVVAAITIQRKWRARIFGTKVRSEYENLRSKVIVVQRRVRANGARKIARDDYVRTRTIIARIQKRWRDKLYNRKRAKAATIIQMWWRSIVDMRKCKMRYFDQKNAALILQRRYRAYRTGVETRRNYVEIVNSVVRIQRRWRMFISRKRHEERMRKCEKAVSIIEIWWLEVLRIKRMREEKLAVLRRDNEAATKIQTAWRGYGVRRKQCEVMKELRERSKRAAQAAVPSATVAFRMKESTDKLLGCDTVGQLSMCLTTLDTLTRLSLNGSIAFCKRNLVDLIYETLNKSNRSLPWMDVCISCTSILITLGKYPETQNYVYRVDYIETLARLMTITCERRVDLFLYLATLLWILAENPQYSQAITSCPRSTWLLSSLYTTINKKKNRLSTTNLNKSRGRDQAAAQLPNTKPDWGLTQKRPRLFKTVHHAIESLIKRLKIDAPT